MYRHIIKSVSTNKELNAKLDRLDKYFYDVLNLIPMHEMLNSDSEELAMASKMYKDTLAISNDFADLLVEEDEKLNMIDTKLDGLEKLLADINDKLEKKTMTKAELAEALNMPESTVRERLKN